MLRTVVFYGITEYSGLRYGRQWIDKKEPGDAGRPLGVPWGEDRIYGHKITRIMEAYLNGTKQIPNNQQGGISGRGALTFLKALAQNFHLSERIFEFDIKGYFDHIDHESILNLFSESKVIRNYLIGALKAKPLVYAGLPASDKATLENQYYNAIKESLLEDVDELMETYPGEVDFWDDQPIQDMIEGLLALIQPVNMNSKEFSQKLMFDVMEYIAAEEPQSKRYSDLMKGLPTTVDQMLDSEGFLTNERYLGRDKWKDLDLPNQGVPQGSSFGPIVASVLLGKIMPTNALLYMDDGLIFLGKSRVTKNTMIKRVNRWLAPIKCELSPEKSGILSTTKLWRTGVKIIGFRIKRTIFTGINISTETRKGIKKPVFEFNRENVLEMLKAMYLKGHITISKFKIYKWYLEKGKLDKAIGSNLIEFADRLGILGALTSRAYSPEVSLEEMKQQIEYGIFKAELKLKNSKGSLGERIINAGKTFAIECTEKKVHVKPTLFNVRSIANDVLLRYLKGEQPVRSLRIQGMRKPFNRESLKTSKSKIK
jgi:hypothetical protein